MTPVRATTVPRSPRIDTRRGRITVLGRFSLAESIDFGFGARRAETGSAMRLAFVTDDYEGHAAVVVTQPGPHDVHCEVVSAPDPEAALRQTARMLSIDVDGTGWDELGVGDRLIRALQRARPGLRPPLFHSAYEAAAWAVLSARRPASAMTALRDRLAEAHGASFDLAGQVVHAFPTPEQLLRIGSFPGLPEEKLTRMQEVARWALEGRLDTDRLRALDPAEAQRILQGIKGIGPFYSMLVVVRALGHTDVLAEGEPRLLATLGHLLARPGPATQKELETLAEGWRPWRTWATVAIRAAGPRLAPLTGTD
ncbi:DNA-3-methyladenine glycosylase family protein [Nocardia terpenica]|uniref:Fe-S cluster assembly protein HesB n=1 Tax=Nocardia terpenica TaxID=455432 RepID=A0A291RFX8_9NOCA|nr:DNA-3-methyladenine glycosylase [Nocardia terpenica]ATL66267.1 Fe-S cluster assembly protein HesB [Nocardia terpenica]